MKTKILIFVTSLFAILSCDFRQSVSTDLITGLNTSGDGLSCDDVYLSDGEQKIQRTSFKYGETFYLKFENIEGFVKENNLVFADMQLIVTNENGDTVMNKDNLYSDYADGIDLTPLLLLANLTVADPIHSNKDYKLFVNIWDKRGDGTFQAKLDFDVVRDDQIEIQNNNISYDEIYLWSKTRKSVVTDNRASLDETIFLMFEGLDGFVVEDGKVFAKLDIIAEDANGRKLLNELDLIGKLGMEYSKFRSQLAPNFSFTGSDIKNPVSCEISISDKKSENSIMTSVQLYLE